MRSLFSTSDTTERRVRYILDLAGVISITFMPFVSTEDRIAWEEFSVANQGWLKEGLAVQGDNITQDSVNEEESLADLERTWGYDPDLKIPEELFRIEGDSLADESEEGPYAPWWQFAPAFPHSGLVNYNTLSHESRKNQIEAIMQTHQPLVSEAFDYATNSTEVLSKKSVLQLYLNHRGGDVAYEAGPVSDLYYPIFEDHDNKKIVGTLTAYVYWQLYFENGRSFVRLVIFVVLSFYSLLALQCCRIMQNRFWLYSKTVVVKCSAISLTEMMLVI